MAGIVRPHALGAPSSRRYSLALACLLISGVTCVAPFVALAQSRPLITSVVLAGTHAVDNEELRHGLATQKTRCRSVLFAPMCLFSQAPLFAHREYLDPREVERDMLRIRLVYWRRGYRDATVTSQTTKHGRGVRVQFNVQENAPTIMDHFEIVQPESLLSARTIRSALHLKSGDPLDLIAIDSARLQFRDALWDRGYADAIIALDTSHVSNALNRGPVSIAIHPGALTIVRNIEVEGNNQIQPATVVRLMHLSPGRPYRRRDLLESQRTLFLSGLFSDVEIGVRPGSDSNKTVVARVTEGPLHRLTATSGFTTADFLQLEGRFTRFHFLGGARRLTLRTTLSNLLAPTLNGTGPFYDVTNGATEDRNLFLRPTWSASVDYLEPWAFGPSNQVGVSVYTHRRSVPGVVTDFGTGASFTLSRDLAPRTTLTAGYTFETSKIDASDVYFCVSVGLCVRDAITAVARRHSLSPISLVGRFDDANDPSSPTRGVRVSVELEHASVLTASDFAYHRAALEASTYHAMSRRLVLAAHAKFGIVHPLAATNARLGEPDSTTDIVIHPRKYFFAGGAQSVRGFGENQLGPRVLTIDPSRLTDPKLASPCTTASLTNGSCDPNIAGVPTSAFQSRPLGGTSLVEGSVELRFPISSGRSITGAVFVDGAVVGTHRFGDLLKTTSAITPGFGIRLKTTVGPVRLDVGVRPSLVSTLPVITQISDSKAGVQLVTLRTLRRFDESSGGGGVGAFLNRLTLHLAIGPSF